MRLDESTTIPLWAALGTIPMFVGLVSWMTFQAYSSAAYGEQFSLNKTETKEKFQEISQEMKEMNRQNQMILEKVIRIEEQTKRR